MNCQTCSWCIKQKRKSQFMYYAENKKVMSDEKWIDVCTRFPQWRVIFSPKTHYCGEIKEQDK